MIEERIETLELELSHVIHRLRWLLAGSVIVCATLACVWASTQITPAAQAQVAKPAQAIRATAFLLIDEKGDVRAQMRMDKAGPALSLADENGTPRAILCVGKPGPWLSLLDEKGNPRAGLRVGKDASVLSLYNEKGKTRAGLALNEEGPVLFLTDENGGHRAWLGIAENQGSKDQDGPKLILYDDKGKKLWSAP